MKATTQAQDGLVIVDKPQGLTSHDVVARVRRLAGTRKVGHAGTLDPMATGVLVIGVGRATRLLTHIVGANKTYLATIRVGVGTDSDDADGSITQVRSAEGVTPEQVGSGILELTGDIQQIPSSVSAIKVAGKRAYSLVRDGQTVELKARPVTVSSFELLAQRAALHEGVDVLDLDVLVSCTTGTYVRALARDLADSMELPGHLTFLRRTDVGGYGLAQARTLDELGEELEAAGRIDVLPLTDSAQAIFPTRALTRREATALGYGKRIGLTPEGEPRDRAGNDSIADDSPADDGANQQSDLAEGQVLCGVDPEDVLIALLTVTGQQLRPTVVFVPAGGTK